MPTRLRLLRALVLCGAALLASEASAQDPDCPPGHLGLVAPTYAEALADDAAARADLEAYVCALRPEQASTVSDVVALLTLREAVVTSAGAPLETWHLQQSETDWEGLFAEAESIGLRPVQAEGMLFGLAESALLAAVTAVDLPGDLELTIQIRAAEGETRGGEYPFADLAAEVELVRLNEILRRQHPASPFVTTTQEAFGDALLQLASLHPVAGDSLTRYAGVATSEFYPWAGDRSALERAAALPDSRYAAPLRAILDGPPVARVEGPLDVLVAARAGTVREARVLSLAFLDIGVDVVGPLAIPGEGWGGAFRYSPAGDPRVAAAAARAEALSLDIERVRLDALDLWEN